MSRVGTYEWAKRNGGALTKSERRFLGGEIVKGFTDLAIHRTRDAMGHVPEAAKDFDADALAPPDSKLCKEAEAACAEQPDLVIGHSYRTWMYGSALAVLDGETLEPEHFYVASLLHDAGIASPVPGEDFTIRSAEAAMAAAERGGADQAARTAIADGICGHITPGAKPERDGTLTCYVQDGAAADLIGLRRWQVAPAVRTRATQEHPPKGCGRAVATMWKAESKAVPAGRAALLQRVGGFSHAVRFGPVR